MYDCVFGNCGVEAVNTSLFIPIVNVFVRHIFKPEGLRYESAMPIFAANSLFTVSSAASVDSPDLRIPDSLLIPVALASAAGSYFLNLFLVGSGSRDTFISISSRRTNSSICESTRETFMIGSLVVISKLYTNSTAAVRKRAKETEREYRVTENITHQSRSVP